VTDGEPRGTRRLGWLAGFGILLAAAALLLELASVSLACGFDTSSCADSSRKTGAYAGRAFASPLVQDEPIDVLRDQSPSEPYANRTIYLAFESRSRVEEPAVAIQTDGEGDFCVHWAQERSAVFVRGEEGEPLPNTGSAPTASGQTVPYPSYVESPPPDCQETSASVPWHRAHDLGSTWQAWTLLLLPALGAAALLASFRRPVDTRSRWVFAGLALIAADAVAYALLWDII
jgi:hypothetical protein